MPAVAADRVEELEVGEQRLEVRCREESRDVGPVVAVRPIICRLAEAVATPDAPHDLVQAEEHGEVARLMAREAVRLRHVAEVVEHLAVPAEPARRHPRRRKGETEATLHLDAHRPRRHAEALVARHCVEEVARVRLRDRHESHHLPPREALEPQAEPQNNSFYEFICV